jgi:hypothetical protein
MVSIRIGQILLAMLFVADIAFGEETRSILFEDSYGALLPASTPDVGLWWASSGWKVARTRPLPKRTAKAVEIRLAQNEREAAQVVVRPAKALTGFTVAASALTSPAGSSIAAEHVEVLRVQYVNVERPSDVWGVAAPWPDPLPPLTVPLTLAANENQPFWIRVYAPKDTPAGDYAGTVTLRADGYAVEVPLRVRVYDFALPDRMTCTTAFGFSAGAVYQYHGLEDPEQQRLVLEKYWASLSAHHISPYGPTPGVEPRVEWVKRSIEQCAGVPPADAALLQAHPLTPVFDWAAWDAEMQRVFDTYHFTSFRLGIPGLAAGEYQGFPDGSREYSLAFTGYCQAVQEHLREKGWLDEAYVYWTDEPAEKDYPWVMKGFLQLKEAAPDIIRMLTEQPEPPLAGGPNLWCPLISMYRHEKTLDFRARGDRFWWYVCTVPKRPFPGLFIDHPGTDLRVWLWQTWKYDIEGILIWQSNLWTTGAAYPDKPQNPYEDTMSWMHGYGTKVGEKRPWGNGDGRFMYPPEAAANAQPPQPVLDGPVDSIRWEMLRDGIEDYEYLATLKRLLAERGAGLPKRLRVRCEKLLSVPEEIAADTRTYTKDPAPLEKRRDQIAKTIERLN